MLKKTYVKSRGVCKVTFEIPADELPHPDRIEKVTVVGDFNDWDEEANTMNFVKSRKVYSAKIDLEPDESYQFRYLVNGEIWVNDWHADAYAPNEFSADNCVVHTLPKPE